MESRTHTALTRRRLLQALGIGLPLLGGGLPLQARALARAERRLSFHNLHTGEHLTTCYWAEGRYLASECQAIDHLLRDFRTGDIHPIDRRLLDLLYVLQRQVRGKGPFQVISGYRSPATNRMLRQRGHHVALHSMHLQGKAIDIRLPGCSLRHLHRAALALRAGGVGYYPRSNFVHVDTGRVRSWRG